MNGDALLERWLLDVRALPLVTEGRTQKCASENMLLFPTSELQALGVGVGRIGEFLVEAYREYGRKAPG